MKKLLTLFLLGITLSCSAQKVEAFKSFSFTMRTKESNWNWENYPLTAGYPIVKIYRNSSTDLTESIYKIIIWDKNSDVFTYALPNTGRITSIPSIEFGGYDEEGKKLIAELVKRGYGTNEYFELYIRYPSIEICFKFNTEAIYNYTL